MPLALIGMSNVGKSFWARQLGRQGFHVYDCDQLIADRLKHAKLIPNASVSEIASWMGLPHVPGARERQAIYLELEAGVLRDALDDLSGRSDERVVIDTTGSVIYLDETLLSRLADATNIILLDATPEVLEHMIRQFFEHPKPVIWGEHYAPDPEETWDQALRRCYPDLMRWRSERYRALASTTVPYEQHRHPSFDLLLHLGL